jgi:hypothetical protein
MSWISEWPSLWLKIARRVCFNRWYQRKEVVRLSHMLIGTLEVQGR